MLEGSGICRILPEGDSGSAGKTKIRRPDPYFELPRPAVLLQKIRLCSAVFDFSPHFRKQEIKPSVGKRKTRQSPSERQPVKRKNRLSAAPAEQAEYSDPKLVAVLCIQGTNSPHHGANSLIATGLPDNLKCLTNRSVLNGAVAANYLNTCANGTVILSAHNGPSLRYSSLAFLGHNPTSRPLLKRSINPEISSKQRSRSDNAQACRPSERS